MRLTFSGPYFIISVLRWLGDFVEINYHKFFFHVSEIVNGLDHSIIFHGIMVFDLSM